MKFEKHLPDHRLKNYIKHFAVSENHQAGEYTVFPTSGLVMGFQYKGTLASIKNNTPNPLKTSGISGLSSGYQVFSNSHNTGSILVYFTETGFAHFSSQPVHELFNLSLSLEELFDKNKIHEVEEKLSLAHSDKQRLSIVERFLLSQLKDRQADKLIVEAVKLIYQSKGTIRISELNQKLAISQSPLEKRFRKVVGTSPKKFASIIRFNSLLTEVQQKKSLADICYDYHFFDQAHFIKEFKQFTGHTPGNFRVPE